MHRATGAGSSDKRTEPTVVAPAGRGSARAGVCLTNREGRYRKVTLVSVTLAELRFGIWVIPVERVTAALHRCGRDGRER